MILELAILKSLHSQGLLTDKEFLKAEKLIQEKEFEENNTN